MMTVFKDYDERREREDTVDMGRGGRVMWVRNGRFDEGKLERGEDAEGFLITSRICGWESL